MNHMQILSRSWKILWSYRTLWIFGIIIAFTAGSINPGSNGGGGGGSSQPRNGNPYQVPTPDGLSEFFQQMGQSFNSTFEQLGRWIGRQLTPGFEQGLIAIVVGLCCFFLLLVIVLRIGNYVSQVALVRMVDDHETTGEKKSWRQGFKLGWSRQAWRLFLIDLVIGLPIAGVFIVLLGCAILPLALAFSQKAVFTIAGIIATIGLFFLVLLLGFLVSIALSLIIETIRRVCILQGLGVFDSIRQGWQLFRRNLKDVTIMWLILVGIQLGIALAMIPVALILVIGGGITGVGVGVALYALLQATSTATAGVVAGLIVAVLLFVLVISLPLLFLGGLKETYLSTTWTLTYREMVKGGLQPGGLLPEPPQNLIDIAQ